MLLRFSSPKVATILGGGYALLLFVLCAKITQLPHFCVSGFVNVGVNSDAFSWKQITQEGLHSTMPTNTMSVNSRIFSP